MTTSCVVDASTVVSSKSHLRGICEASGCFPVVTFFIVRCSFVRGGGVVVGGDSGGVGLAPGPADTVFFRKLVLENKCKLVCCLRMWYV